jgi:hypothetical protein
VYAALRNEHWTSRGQEKDQSAHVVPLVDIRVLLHTARGVVEAWDGGHRDVGAYVDALRAELAEYEDGGA